MKRQLSSASLLLGVTMAGGCGFSQSINASVQEQERQFEVAVTKQMLQHTDLLVSAVVARATLVEPQSTARCESIPSTECTICYVATETEQSINLSTPSCSIQTPAEAKDFALTLSLRDLSLAATQTAPDTMTLRGDGHLDLSAQLPVLGQYSGVASYDIRSGNVNTTNGAFSLDLHLAYQSGESTLVELTVTASGTPQALQGKISGPRLECQVSGTLKAPKVSCQ